MSGTHTTATSGLPTLDEVLGGIFWGDNVVLRAATGAADSAAFVRVFASASGYTASGLIAFGKGRTPRGVDTATRLTLTATDIEQSISDALAFGREIGPGGLIIVNDLAGLVERHGEEDAWRFFCRVCPALLRIGAVAHWTLGPTVSDALVERIRAITQIVLLIDAGELVLAKAEARPLSVVGTTLGYAVDSDGRLQLQKTSDATRLGAALAAVRTRRGLSQSQISRLAGVSPSAISQAERGPRGLSISTLMRLASALGITIDELVIGRSEGGYRIRGRTVPHRNGASRVALVDSGDAEHRLYEFRLDPGAHGRPPAQPRGTEMVLLGRGLLLITMTDGTTPVIREGEALIAHAAGIASWRNLDEDQALGFWAAI